jgi:hypothetical protein
VKIATNYHGSGGKPLTSADTSWEPVPCWFEPKFTPEQYETYFRESMKGWSTGKQYVEPHWGELEKEHYNKGKDGLWWQIEYNQAYPGWSSDHCPDYGWPEVWVPTGDPAPPAGVLTPEMLSRLAYQATKLPAPPVMLSPSAADQVVNLPTYVKFENPLDRVWVTASLNAPGVNIAATTVATPVALKIDAGTADASPRSCTYDLTKSGTGYKVDSASSDCNVTYRKSSGTGTYDLQAQITWRVTWTASANPDGPAQQPGLPDGLSTYNQPVTVKEVQTVNR